MSQDSWNTEKYRNMLNLTGHGRGGLMHIFNDSIFGKFRYIWLRIRKIFRKFHMDLYVPILLIFLSACFTTIWLWQSRESTGNLTHEYGSIYNFTKDAGSIFIGTITIMFAMGSLHRDFHLNKRKKASDYIRIWYSNEMHDVIREVGKIYDDEFWNSNRTVFSSELFDQAHSVIAEYKKTADGIIALQAAQSRILIRIYSRHNKKHNVFSLEKQYEYSEKDSVNRLLAFFEHMGQDVKRHVVDSDYLKDFFYSIALNNYELLRKYIEYLQVDRSNRITCSNFVYLAQTWEKEGSLPELPRICIRPLVLTTDDLDSVAKSRDLD